MFCQLRLTNNVRAFGEKENIFLKSVICIFMLITQLFLVEYISHYTLDG